MSGFFFSFIKEVVKYIHMNAFYHHTGKTVKTGTRGRVQVFPFVMDDPIGPARTSEESKAYATKAATEGASVS